MICVTKQKIRLVINRMH